MSNVTDFVVIDGIGFPDNAVFGVTVRSPASELHARLEENRLDH